MNILLRTLLIVPLLFGTVQSNVEATDRTFCKKSLSISTILYSDHVGSRSRGRKWNEDQWPSLIGQCNGWLLGFYQNSFSTGHQQLTSWIFAKGWPIGKSGPFKFSTSIGIANGYPEKYSGTGLDKRVTKKRWIPWGSLNAKIGIFKVYWVPTTVTGFGLEWEFK